MIRTGFKLTKAGEIPIEWNTLPLSELFYFGNGYTPSKADSAFWTNGTIPWFRVEDIRINGHVLNDAIQKITPLAVKGELFPKNSFIISTSATIGEYAYVTVPYLANQRFVCLIKKSVANQLVDDGYFLCLCESLGQWCRDNCDQGSSFPSVNMQSFRNHHIPLPPLVEQKKIAKALSDVDVLISDLDALIAKKRDIKQGTMQQLLAGKKRLPGFTDEWREQTLNDICSLSKGIQLNSSKMNDSGLYPVFNGGIAPSGYFSECNTEANTIIISEGGNSCGFVNYIKEPFWRGGHCYSLSNISIDKVFLYHILKFNEASIMALRTGSGLPNIKKSTLANFCLKNPQSISEQQAIATILTDMDDEIQALEAKRDKYTAIKQGMVQELLTGKIRLV